MKKLKANAGTVAPLFIVILLQLSLGIVILIKKNSADLLMLIKHQQKVLQHIRNKRSGFFMLEITLWTLLFGGLLIFSLQLTNRHYQVANKYQASFSASLKQVKTGCTSHE